MILVTGSNGFVGKALCAALHAEGTSVRAAVRKGSRHGEVCVGDLSGSTDWSAALDGCETVFHLAARVHVMADKDEDPLRAYREVNVDATLNIAMQAVRAGVRRFVFVSSVKVNGESTTTEPFTSSDVPNPCDPYGQSKMEAEQALQKLGRETGLEVVIVRPPLVYGPGVKANFKNLIKLVHMGTPLPFGSIANDRSMVALDNLVDLLIVCGKHPNAPGEIFMVSDGADMGIKELVSRIASAMKKRPILIPVPSVLMIGAAKMLGKAAVVDRLLGSLQVDISNTQAKLQWTPVIAPQLAINKTVEHFFLVDGRKRRLKRVLDVVFGVIAAAIFFVPLCLLAIVVKATSKGPVLYWSDRVGRGNRIFSMPKLRTMRVDTPVVATHLLTDPTSYLTPVGGFLRKSSLDEIPQLWCIVRGDMSVVGPRPALFNQKNLIDMRTAQGVHMIRPGLTGWAQINGRDALALPEKVRLDSDYIRRQSLGFDIKVILITVLKVVWRAGIVH